MTLDELPVDELRARKCHQFEEARARGALTRLALIARELGRDPISIAQPGYVSTYGPKYLFIAGNGPDAVYVYVDDYGGYMTVHVGGENPHRGGRPVCSTHATDSFFIPGPWEAAVLAHVDGRCGVPQRASQHEMSKSVSSCWPGFSRSCAHEEDRWRPRT